MAQLKSTTIQGSARVTDTLYSNALQAKIVKAPTASNGTTYGPGSDGQVLKSNGTSVYWASDSNSDVNVKQLAAITTAGSYPIILANSTATTEVTGSVNKSSNLTYNPSTKALSTGGTINGLTFTAASTGFTIAGGTTSKTLTVSNTYTLGAACAKGVTDNSSNADVTSSDTNLITGRTLYYQLAKKGYTTNTGTVTSVTLTQGAGITVSDSGTAITASGSRTISITGMDTTSGSTSKCLTEKGTWASFSNNAGTVTSVQVQASSPLQSSTSTAQSASLSTTISFVNQDPNKVLAGPSSGSSAGAPSFRSLVAADIPDLAWSKITSGKPTTLSGYGITDAAASDHTQAVNKGGTNITSYTIGDILYASGTSALSKLAGNTTTTVKYLKSVATTSGTAVAPVWAQIAASEISGLGTMATANTGDYAVSGHTQAVNKGGTNITSYTIGDILYASAQTTLSKLAGNTTTTVKFLKSVATTSGTAVAPAWAQISASDISGLGTMATANTGDYATSDHTQAVNKGGTNITSYTIGDILYASGQTALSKLAGNTTTTVKYLKSVATTSGTAVAPTWAQIASSDISGLGAAATKAVTDNSSNADVTSTDTNLITGRTLYYQLAKKGYTTNTGTVTSVTLIAGSGIALDTDNTAITTSGSRTISISGMNTSSGSTSKCLTEKGTWASFTNNAGTVTSVTLTQGAGITVSDSGTAITGSGSRTISITGMNTSSGSTSKCLTEKGTWVSFTNNAGTVTSVQVQASGPLSSSTSTAQSSTLSTTISFSNQDPNKVLAGPDSGSTAGAPSFRALVAADIPGLPWSKITSGTPTTVAGYGITDAVSTSALSDYLPLSGGTMTGAITLHTTGLYTANEAGYSVNQYGNFTHRRSNTNDTWGIVGANGDAFKVYFDTGKTTITSTAGHASALTDSILNMTTSDALGTNKWLYGASITAPNAGSGTHILGCMFGTAASAGNLGYIGFYSAGSNSGSSFVTIGIHTNDDLLKIYKSGGVQASGDVTVKGGNVWVDKSDYPYVHLRNASGQEVAGLWANVSSKRVYLRVRPSAGSSYATDFIFPAAASANANKYVYTSDNFSLSGTTLTITPPSS